MKKLLSFRSGIFLIVLVIISLWAMKALFHPGFYTSHDGWHQVARLFHFTQGLKDGQFPPRWGGLLLNGFGYPLFIFSYHLPWWLATPFYFLGMDIFNSIKIIFILTYVLSGVVMFCYVKEMWGKIPGFIAALFYLFTPYRFVTILVRANMGEAVSFATVPLIFWGIYRISRKKIPSGVILTSLGIFTSLLSHVMISNLFIIPIILYMSVVFKYLEKSERKTFIIWIVCAGVIGTGLSMYYLLPAIYYQPLTVFEQFKGIYRNLYKDHFTPLSKLLYSPWGYGAIGSGSEMSRGVGLIIWTALILSCTVFLKRVLWLKKAKLQIQDWFATMFIISTVTAIFMMMKESHGVWKFIEAISPIDFPWRYLAVTTFCGSMLGAYLIYQRGRLKYLLFLVFIVGLLYTNRNYMRVNQYTDIPLSLYIASEDTTNTDDEYLPKWVDRNQAEKENVARILAPEAKIDNLQQNSKEITFNYSSPKEVKLTLNHMYFPGMEFFIDTQKFNINKSGSGSIEASVPAGVHAARLLYIPTDIMNYGNLITIFSALIPLVLCLRISKHTKKSI